MNKPIKYENIKSGTVLYIDLNKYEKFDLPIPIDEIFEYLPTWFIQYINTKEMRMKIKTYKNNKIK